MAGLTTLLLPSVVAAASAGGAGGESPTFLNTTTFTADPSAYGHPVGGVWATASAQQQWRFHITLADWTLPALDNGKTDASTLVYTYEISPNNQTTWHQLSLVPRDISNPGVGSPIFGVWVSFSLVPETYYGDPVPTNGLTWTRTDEGADGEWDWVTNAYVRVLDNGTVIDVSPPFWLW